MVMGLGGLSAAARASYSIIQAGVARGLSSKAINADIALRYGQGIRRTDLLQGMRLASGVQQAGRNIGNIPFANRPNYATLPTFSPITSNKKYLVQYEIRWGDPVTGERGSNWITIGTDETLTRAELDQAAMDAWTAGQQEQRYGEGRMLDRVIPLGARQQII
tara:strand:+ start:83 stop:571 length:489 start_codon:yes stop_codon:yes gene_type:complete